MVNEDQEIAAEVEMEKRLVRLEEELLELRLLIRKIEGEMNYNIRRHEGIINTYLLR